MDIRKHERKFARSFYSQEELEELSDRERIRKSAKPDHAFIHKFLAKDNPDYPQSKLRWDSSGPTLFELALELAQRDTALRWKMLEREMSPQVSSVLRSGWFSDLPESSEQSPVRIQRARVVVDSELTFQADFTFTCRNWNRASAKDAVDLFHKLTSDQVRMSPVRDGVRRLELSKSEAEKTFLFRLEANLYGGNDTFLTALPEDETNLTGAWILQVKLPPERAATTAVKVDSPGQVEALGGNRFRLTPPSSGWRLPQWVDEYVADPKPSAGSVYSYSGCKTRG